MKDNKYLVPILLIISVIMVIIGSTFAYWSWQSSSSQKTNVTFTIGSNFSCSADGGGNITNNAYLAPTSCTNSTYAIQRTITTNITNSGSDPVYMDMWLNIDNIGSGLTNSENFKYALTTSSSSCTSGVIASGTFYGKETGDTIQLLDDVNSGSTYYLYIWIDSAETNQSVMNQPISLSLGGECTNQEPPTVMAKIAKNAVIDNTSSTYVTNSNGVQFNAASSDTNGKGVYIRSGTENTDHPIYYYRGAVTDNNLLFGGFCWKIVRTTDTGGIKLIYNGLPTGTNSDQCTNTTGAATQLSTNSAFNSNSDSPAYVGYMYGTVYSVLSQNMTSITDTYMYGTGYDATNHRLVATNAMNFAGTNWGTYYNQLNNNHYTCFNTSGECSEVYYIYYTKNTAAYYVTIPSGKTISGMLNEMLTNSSNTTSSTIKTALDTWYSTNMTSYTSYLEDTLWCNDRSISSLGGWDPNGGDTTQRLTFGGYDRVYNIPSFTCSKNDAFTVNETNTGNGDLTYPVGLLTIDEIMLAGGRAGTGGSTYYLNTDQYYWYASPYSFYNTFSSVSYMALYGVIGADGVYNTNRVRPSVSLRPGTVITSGDGTSTSPYIVE